MACQIVAGNAFNGYLTLGREKDSPRVSNNDNNGTLNRRDYYFIVPHPTGEALTPWTPYRYPTVPHFSCWRILHQQLPSLWEDIRESDPEEDRHIRCVLSDHADGVEDCHLVPKKEIQWFRLNSMNQYNKNKMASETIGQYNIARMRSDIHTIFDKGNFILVPMCTGGLDSPVQLVSPFLNRTQNLCRQYHNCPIDNEVARSPEFLFTRFA